MALNVHCLLAKIHSRQTRWLIICMHVNVCMYLHLHVLNSLREMPMCWWQHWTCYIISILAQPPVRLSLFVPQIEAMVHMKKHNNNHNKQHSNVVHCSKLDSMLQAKNQLYLPVSVRNYNKYSQTMLTWAKYLYGQIFRHIWSSERERERERDR